MLIAALVLSLVLSLTLNVGLCVSHQLTQRQLTTLLLQRRQGRTPSPRNGDDEETGTVPLTVTNTRGTLPTEGTTIGAQPTLCTHCSRSTFASGVDHCRFHLTKGELRNLGLKHASQS